MTKLVWPVMKTFQLEILKVDMDTDNYVLNAQLIPFFVWISNDKIRLSVNFEGKASLYLLITNRLVKIVPVVIRYLLFK